MHFVDDIYLIFTRYGRILHLFAQVAHFVHAVVGRRVYLGNIEVGRIGERAARGAFSAGRTVLRRFAVDRRREYFRDTRFTRSARSAEKVRVTDPARRDLIFQYGDDMFLSYDVV